MLEVDGLEFGYDEAMMRFELDVGAGEVLSLIGPSGAGKSTLLHLIAGFLEPMAGRIRIDGEAIERWPPARRPVTIVFQQHNLFPHLDLRTNVALGIDPSLALNAAQTEALAAALARVGLDGLERRKPGEVSGGQRQRAALARVLVRARPVLLLDEAFAALGPAQREELLDLVTGLVRERSMAALLVSHQPRDALLVSARCAFVDRGRIERIAPTRELLEDREHAALRAYLGTR